MRRAKKSDIDAAVRIILDRHGLEAKINDAAFLQEVRKNLKNNGKYVRAKWTGKYRKS